MRNFVLLIAATVSGLLGTTLEQLSFDDMLSKSTSIVRGKIGEGRGEMIGRMVYTRYSVQVSETFKGPAAANIDIMVPGGSANGLTQSIGGSPKLTSGSEMVLFLWRSPKNINLVIGMSQGAFDITITADGELLMVRNAVSGATVLDKSLKPVSDSGMRFTMTELRKRTKQ